MSIPEYKLLSETSTVCLSKKVNEFIEDGWDLYGNPFEHLGGWICQAVVNYNPTKTRIEETP